MTAEDLEPRPNRRLTDRGRDDDPRARQRHLVRHINADPVLIQWLATSKARTLTAVAADLTAAGHVEAAELVTRYALRLANGTVTPL